MNYGTAPSGMNYGIAASAMMLNQSQCYSFLNQDNKVVLSSNCNILDLITGEVVRVPTVALVCGELDHFGEVCVHRHGHQKATTVGNLIMVGPT